MEPSLWYNMKRLQTSGLYYPIGILGTVPVAYKKSIDYVFSICMIKLVTTKFIHLIYHGLSILKVAA